MSAKYKSYVFPSMRKVEPLDEDSAADSGLDVERGFRKKKTERLNILDSSRENIEDLPDDAIVRVIHPVDRWNQTTLISSRDTVLAHLLGENNAKKVYWFCSGRFVVAIVAIFIVDLFLGNTERYLPERVPYQIWIISILNVLWACVTLFGFCNRFLLLELARYYECWYIFTLGLILGASFLHGGLNSEDAGTVRPIKTFLVIVVANSALTICDAWNPAHKVRSLRAAIIAGVFVYCAILRQTHSGDMGPFFKVVEFQIGGILSSNADIISRATFILLTFMMKYLYRAIFYPERTVIMSAGLNNKKFTKKDLRQECATIQSKHRLSQIPSLALERRIQSLPSFLNKINKS